MSYSIPEAAKLARVTPAWIRAAIRHGELESDKTPVTEGSLVMKHLISEEALHRWLNREGKKAPRREDSRGKWTFYATPEEARRIKEVLYQTDEENLKVVASTIQPNSMKERYLNEHNILPSE